MAELLSSSEDVSPLSDRHWARVDGPHTLPLRVVIPSEEVHLLANEYRDRDLQLETPGRGESTYSADEIDFLVAYVFPKDVWYVFPAAIIAGRDSVCLRPESKKCRQVEFAYDMRLFSLDP